MEPKKLKILSLDGGGIRGLSSLVLLQGIMSRVGGEMNPPRYDLEPHEYFDLIGGTSTGGIIALMLGRLRMSVGECITQFAKLGKLVFSDRLSPPHEHMFKAKRLEEAIKSVIKQQLGNENVDAPLLDPLGNDCCKTIVFTLPESSPNHPQPIGLRSYRCKHDARPKPWTIWQAARATSAAPTFFEPLTFGIHMLEQRYIDAGMKFNNPSRAIRAEASRLWDDGSGHMNYNKDIAVFLSLGTGFAAIARLSAETLKEHISAKFQVPLKAVEVMKAIVSDTQTTDTDLARDFAPNIYFRFNVEQGLQDVQLFEYEKYSDVMTDTEGYMIQRDGEIRQCVKEMAGLSMNVPPLAERRDEDQIFGPADQAEDHLQRRLQALRINPSDFEDFKGAFMRSRTMRGICQRLHTAKMFNASVQADLLDKQGRILAEKTTVERYTNVKHRISANQRLREAFIIYRHLLHTTQSRWTSSSLEHCWVAHRLGEVLEYFGLLNEAFHCFATAVSGREDKLGSMHEVTMKSRQHLENLRQHKLSHSFPTAQDIHMRRIFYPRQWGPEG